MQTRGLFRNPGFGFDRLKTRVTRVWTGLHILHDTYNYCAISCEKNNVVVCIYKVERSPTVKNFHKTENLRKIRIEVVSYKKFFSRKTGSGTEQIQNNYESHCKSSEGLSIWDNIL